MLKTPTNKRWLRACETVGLVSVAIILLTGSRIGGQVTHQEAQTALDAWAAEKEGEVIRIHVEGNEETTYVGCPVLTVCDENARYRAFVVRDRGVSLRLSFASVIAREISLDLLRRHFNVASLLYRPPELNFDNWDVRLGGGDTVRRGNTALQFHEWDGERLQGEIRISFQNVHGRVTRRDTIGAALSECFLMDTSLPEECSVRSDVSVPMILSFDIPLSTGTVDCTGDRTTRPRGCGN